MGYHKDVKLLSGRSHLHKEGSKKGLGNQRAKSGRVPEGTEGAWALETALRKRPQALALTSREGRTRVTRWMGMW